MSSGHDDGEFPSPGYAWYVVGVLTIAYVFSFIDRQIINLLVGPIQRDLEISDTEISLLGGASFAVFYTLFGIPIGRLADTKSRRAIISIGIAFWSVMTAGCGLTTKYWDLALMRMGVGVGEATLSPAAYSLIADYFPPRRRATAMSVYSMGIYIGSGLAFILGGMVVQFASVQENFVLPLVGAVRSWQLVFFIVGLPGLLVALLLLTVKEPMRKGLTQTGSRRAVLQPVNLTAKGNDRLEACPTVNNDRQEASPTLQGSNAPAAVSMRETFVYLRDNCVTFLCLNLGIAMVTLNSYASSFWIPSMLIRRFEWGQGQTGLVYGTIIAICGTLGVVAGGWMADWWTQKGHADAPLRVAWMSCLFGLPCTILYPLAPTGGWTAVLLVPMVFFISMPFGVAPAAIQRMMPNTMRAQATAIYLFAINLIGMVLGPTAAAVLTERVFHDKNAVNYSLLIVGVVTYSCAILLLGISLKCYRRSLEYLKTWSQAQASEA